MSASAVAVVTATKLGSQTQGPSPEERLRKMWCGIYTGIITALKRNEVALLAKLDGTEDDLIK